MKITTIQAKQFGNSYSKLKTLDLPLQLAFNLNKIAAALDNDMKFVNEKIENTILKYCVKDEKGNPQLTNGNYKIQEDKIDECNRVFKEIDEFLLDAGDYSFSITDFGDIKIDLETMQGLMPFIKG